MQRRRLLIVAAAGLLGTFAGILQAQTPATSAFTYQGRLVDSGLPANGNYDFQFRIFNTADVGTGSQLGLVSPSAVPVIDGLFSTALDFGPTPLNGSKRWLQISVRPAGNGVFTTLSTRQELTAAPYAAGLVPPITVSSSQAVDSLNITNNGGSAIYGKTTTGSNTAGVYGVSTAANGTGVRGRAEGATSYGVWGESSLAIGVRGMGALGVFGTGGTGLRGDCSPATGSGSGVKGVGGYRGGDFSSAQPGGVGVYGYANGDASSVGVWGASPTGKAGYFSGLVLISGTLVKSGGSFKIDHPLDPANKYLSHSFVESPDMMNIYNGNIRLDAAGAAVVTMPEWFEALNAEFRYQLTAIGAPAPNIYIAQGIKNRQFVIAGGPPLGEVSWMVTGIRIDPWASANRIPVEELKSPEHRGLYLNPDAFGLPQSASIDSVWMRRMDPAPDTAATESKLNQLEH
jgi:hypothetical protein